MKSMNFSCQAPANVTYGDTTDITPWRPKKWLEDECDCDEKCEKCGKRKDKRVWEPWDPYRWRPLRYTDNTQPCLHKSCQECNGTGRKTNGRGTCVHMISCPCPKCSPYTL